MSNCFKSTCILKDKGLYLLAIGGIAQLGEHHAGSVRVCGSNPHVSTNFIKATVKGRLFCFMQLFAVLRRSHRGSMKPSFMFQAIIACFLWSTAFVGIKIGIPYTTPLNFAGVRFVLAGVITLLFVGNLTSSFGLLQKNPLSRFRPPHSLLHAPSPPRKTFRRCLSPFAKTARRE